MRSICMKNKFDICDVVKVVTTRQELAYINNSEGYVFEITQDENASEQIYSVSIFMDDGLCWDVLESEMLPTGKKMDPKKVFSNKFHEYEVVKVVSTRMALAKINNCEGYISGMSQNEITDEWTYAVTIPEDDDLGWSVPEAELLPTGKKIDPKQIYTGESIRVSVDPKTGEGKLIDSDED
jgi:hypothetical protein